MESSHLSSNVEPKPRVVNKEIEISSDIGIMLESCFLSDVIGNLSREDGGY